MDLLIKRGSKKAVDSYIGKKGELFLDQENDSLRISDASTAGGLEILKKDHNGDYVINSKQTTWIHNSTNNSYVDISGGSESTFVKAAGASLIMSGADYTGIAIPAGSFYSAEQPHYFLRRPCGFQLLHQFLVRQHPAQLLLVGFREYRRQRGEVLFLKGFSQVLGGRAEFLAR